jgi:hypothetical protein
MEMSLIIFYPFWMPWKCDNWPGGGTRPTAKSSDQTMMKQWCNCDATVMPLVWALLCHFEGMEMPWIIFYPLAMPLKQLSNIDEAMMEQWCDSDAFDLSSFLWNWRFCDLSDDNLFSARGCWSFCLVFFFRGILFVALVMENNKSGNEKSVLLQYLPTWIHMKLTQSLLHRDHQSHPH